MSIEMIMALMERIIKLESRVTELEKNLASNPHTIPLEKSHSLGSGIRTYGKMTEDLYRACYECGKRFRDGEYLDGLVDELAAEGMNRDSSEMYLQAIKAILNGDPYYTRSISQKSLAYFLKRIADESGEEGLTKAVRTIRGHLAYKHKDQYAEKGRRILDLCDEYDPIK